MSDKIKYNGPVAAIPPAAETILLGIMEKSCVDSVLITSTVRSPADQARIMYANLNGPENDKKEYIERQLKLYGDNGDRVIRVFEQQLSIGASAADTMRAMEHKILEIGPEKVSAHCVVDPKKSVFDIAPSSIPEDKKKAFANQAAVTRGVAKVFYPPIDPAFHLLINLA